jgi:hypothetical protein
MPCYFIAHYFIHASLGHRLYEPAITYWSFALPYL